MKIGIIGLGLIGGSLASAFSEAGHHVLGFDKDKSVRDFAKMAGSISEVLEEGTVEGCEVIFLAIPPENAIDWLKSNSIAPETLVIDCCGTKRNICREGFALAKEGAFKFVGGHPMAGKHVGGFKNSNANLFRGALFAIVPDEASGDKGDIRLLSTIKDLLMDAGFTSFAVLNPEEHDKIIAFTSQMVHLVSNAYIKSPRAEEGIGAGLSGGSYRDMTRVAYLDENMWTQLFMENRDNLLHELDEFMDELELYREAIKNEDRDALTRLLTEGKLRKKEIEDKVTNANGESKRNPEVCPTCNIG